MPEVYRYKAPGHWAGEKCVIKKCTNYARFVLQPFNDATVKPEGYCGHHISTGAKGMQAITHKALVVQEVPGNWGRELVAFEGQIGMLPAADRVS